METPLDPATVSEAVWWLTALPALAVLVVSVFCALLCIGAVLGGNR